MKSFTCGETTLNGRQYLIVFFDVYGYLCERNMG